MNTISDYTQLNVSQSDPTVISKDGTTVTVNNQTTNEVLYLVALVNNADTANNLTYADTLNQMQAKSEENKKVIALITGLNNIDTSAGYATGDVAYAALRASTGLDDDAIASLYQKITGKTLTGNTSGNYFGATDCTSALSLAKTYSQNLADDNSVLQSKLDNMANLRTSFNEAMSSLINLWKTTNQSIVRNLS